jgi:2-phospho-L-lactate guanylyltransferase
MPNLHVAVLVPVKAFALAKRRLAEALELEERAALARTMATRVVHAAGGLPVAVACDDEAVAAWAEGVGARVVWTPGLGLNGAVTAGVVALADAGADRVVVAHADLPHATDLTVAAGIEGVVVVPDRHDDGTNVLSVPARSGLRFAYGPASFPRHTAEARRLGLPVVVLRPPDLTWDVDVPADLAGAEMCQIHDTET